MTWWGRSSVPADDSALFTLAFRQGEQLGRLTEKLDQAAHKIAALEAQRPPGDALPGLDAQVEAVVSRLSRAQPDLYRHLHAQAKDLLGKGVEARYVIEQLERGSRRPRLEQSGKAS